MVEQIKSEETVKMEEVKADIKKEETADGAAVEDSKAIEGVKERLKFFFSDANIRQDVFIRKLLMDSDEKSVGVNDLLKFNTIKKHTDKPATVIQAAKELSDSLVVDEEKMTISRTTPFTKEMMNQNIPLSLYVKNLPLNENKKYDVSVGELRALFEKYGEIALVKLKFSSYPDNGKHSHYGPSSKKKRRNFPIGAAMIEFQKQEDLEKAAEATLTTKEGAEVEPKDKVVLPESETRKTTTELGVMLLSEYVEMRKEKKVKRDDKKRKEAEPEEEKEIPKFEFDWKPNCVIKLIGLPEGCNREAMLSTIGKALDISVDDVKDRKIYVDYSRGQKDGAIRFPEPSENVAEIAKKLKAGELMILDAKVEDAFALEGEDEKTYWDEFIAFKNKQMIQRAEEKKNSRGKKRHKTGRQ